MQPTDISLTAERGLLRVSWPDGRLQSISALTLRSLSRSARSLSKRLEEGPPDIEPDLKIENVELVGQYAINIQFSDGYDKGIYPWDMLRDIG